MPSAINEWRSIIAMLWIAEDCETCIVVCSGAELFGAINETGETAFLSSLSAEPALFPI